MRGAARQKVGRQDRWTTDIGVTRRGVARRLNLLLSLLIGMRITRDGISEPQFVNIVKGV